MGFGYDASIGLGQQGFDRIIGTETGNWVAIKAVGGDVTLGAGCETNIGDAPASGDVIQQGDVLSGPFTKIVVSTGVAYAYRSGE